MGGNEITNKRAAIIEATWNYLLRTGLSKASIGDLCKETKLAQSSLYYWFTNKDDIWISAGKYGLAKVVDSLFQFTFDNVTDARQYFDTLLDEVEKYKDELRLAIHITTSMQFGERMRDKSREFKAFYELYAEKIMSVIGCTYRQAEIFIYSIVLVVEDYAIWDDGETSRLLLESLYERIVSQVDLGQTVNQNDKESEEN